MTKSEVLVGLPVIVVHVYPPDSRAKLLDPRYRSIARIAVAVPNIETDVDSRIIDRVDHFSEQDGIPFEHVLNMIADRCFLAVKEVVLEGNTSRQPILWCAGAWDVSVVQDDVGTL